MASNNVLSEEQKQAMQLAHLDRLATSFRIAANQSKGIADKLAAAAKALRDEQEKNRELQLQVKALQAAATGSATKQPQKKAVSPHDCRNSCDR